MAGRWQFWIDRGGTFTDCLGLPPDGSPLRVTKVLSSDRAPLEGIKQLLGLTEEDPIPACDIRMGTTVATNALLERRGTPCALCISTGFGDLLEIGTQARPHLFQLAIDKPARLHQAVLEVDARADAQGKVLTRFDADRVLREMQALRAQGIDSIAIVLLHAYACFELEQGLGALARKAGFSHVALSHEVAPEIGMLARGDTTVVDAYLTPLIRRYVRDAGEGAARQLSGDHAVERRTHRRTPVSRSRRHPLWPCRRRRGPGGGGASDR